MYFTAGQCLRLRELGYPQVPGTNVFDGYIQHVDGWKVAKVPLEQGEHWNLPTWCVVQPTLSGLLALADKLIQDKAKEFSGKVYVLVGQSQAEVWRVTEIETYLVKRIRRVSSMASLYAVIHHLDEILASSPPEEKKKGASWVLSTTGISDTGYTDKIGQNIMEWDTVQVYFNDAPIGRGFVTKIRTTTIAPKWHVVLGTGKVEDRSLYSFDLLNTGMSLRVTNRVTVEERESRAKIVERLCLEGIEPGVPAVPANSPVGSID